MGGIVAWAVGNEDAASKAFADAALDSGHAILDENCASSVEYGAYYGRSVRSISWRNCRDGRAN